MNDARQCREACEKAADAVGKTVEELLDYYAEKDSSYAAALREVLSSEEGLRTD